MRVEIDTVWVVVSSSADGLNRPAVFRTKTQAYSMAVLLWLEYGQGWGPLVSRLWCTDNSGDGSEWFWAGHSIAVERASLWG